MSSRAALLLLLFSSATRGSVENEDLAENAKNCIFLYKPVDAKARVTSLFTGSSYVIAPFAGQHKVCVLAQGAS